MNILVACEESGRVTEQFRLKGHNAFSCDIIETSGNHQEWHIICDVIKIINGHCTFKTQNGEEHIIKDRWDMIIAFPPCTHLAVSGARHFEKKRNDGRQLQAVNFFGKILYADCDKICVENPVNIISGKYVQKWFPNISSYYYFPKKPTQYIEPWQFGDNQQKKTCLWLKGLEPLKPLITIKPYIEMVTFKSGRRMTKFFATTYGDGKTRSKTFPGIAKAMAEQWG